VRAAGSGRGGPDFFISYTQADRAWAEWIAWALEEDGYHVIIQAWDFVPGSNWIERMDEGVRGATRTVAVLSDAYLGSVYGGAEWQTAWAADPAGTDRKLLVARVEDCERPGLLAGVVSSDLHGLTEAVARSRLRAAVAAALTGRAKPSVPPGFPGAERAVTGRPGFPVRLPGVWQVPPHNPHFTGRTAELARLAAALASQPVVTVQSVHGMGGVGKTQLATEYAHAHATGYDIIWQVNAGEPAALPGQFAALAARLGLDPATDSGSLPAQVGEQLRTSGHSWLLIFDNADDPRDIRPWLPSGPLPPGTRGHVLITTRRGGYSTLGPVIDLDVIPAADALALLRTRVPGLAASMGEAIADELGHLPLALEQAAAYLDLTQLPPREYLALLRARPADMHQRGRAGTRTETIATLWDLSLERLTRREPAAAQLAHICGYLASDPIPTDLFTAHPGLLPAPLAEAAADPLAFTDTLAVLLDYALAKRGPAGITLHRLTQAAIRARTPPAPSLAPPPPAPQAGQASHPLVTALWLLGTGAPDEVIGTPQGWPRWAILLPHVLAATTHADAPGGPTDPAVAWLLDRAGTYLHVHAQLGDARPLLERALAISEATHGPDHPDVAASLNDLALVLADLGQPGQARPLQERALAISEAAFGPDHPDVATDLNNLASILLELGQPGQARPLQERALAIDEAAYGPGHPNVAADLDGLASTLLELGRPGQARPLQERALAIDEAAYGPGHPTVSVALSGLASVLRDLGQPGQARPLQERALAIDEAAYGPDHPTVAGDLNNLAVLLDELDEPGQARPLQERALAIYEAAYGPGHPAVANALDVLAGILDELDQPGQARPLQERALAIYEAAYGPGHPAVADTLTGLAVLLDELGETGQARPLQERALAIYEAAYGPGHPAVAGALDDLADILEDLGERDQAQSLQQRALAITETAEDRQPGLSGDSSS
jgi:tetratricopeptide (TPR) repeat protein